MVIIGLVFAVVAAFIHLYIFYLETIVWTGQRSRSTFGIGSLEEAEATKSMAFNQGFYNLFLALAVLIGTVVLATGGTTAGATLIFVGTASMVSAGAVLLFSSPSKASSALKQLVPPLLGIIALWIGLAQ